jgi:hypothetical protein
MKKVNKEHKFTTRYMLRVYDAVLRRMTRMVSKGQQARRRLAFLTESLRVLTEDEVFVALLAAENGLSMPNFLRERIARLGRDPLIPPSPRSVRPKLVNGVCSDVRALLKDKPLSATVMTLLRGVRPIRQIEMAQLMVSLSTYTKVYVHVLLLATPQDQLVKGNVFKDRTGLSQEEIAEKENEMNVLERDFRMIEADYCKNALGLAVLEAYVDKLLEHGRISRFLKSRYPQIHLKIEELTASNSW